uniref:Cytochrome P450 n=1 Tax=Timema douglasi TaxID=61478 RepID=A0A7R8VVU3_TIMDO|nr:unnamed protein product [Timema douglasi]
MSILILNLNVLISVFLLAVLLVAVWLWWSQRRTWKLAKQFPGPKPLPIIGNLLHFKVHNDNFLNNILDVSKTYSPTFRLWMGPKLLIFFTEPDDFEVILNHPNVISRSFSYKITEKFFGQGLFNSRKEIWRRHRKIMNQIFNPKLVQSYVKTFNQESKILINLMEEHSDGNKFDVLDYMRVITLDIIVQTILGINMNIQMNDRKNVIDSMQALKKWAHLGLADPLYWIKNYIPFLNTRYNSIKSICHQMRQFSTNVINKKLNELKEEEKISPNYCFETEQATGFRFKSFLELVLMSSENNCELLKMLEIQDETVMLMTTGTNNTAFMLSCILMLLGLHQDVQQRVVDELVGIFDHDIHRDTTIEDLREMNYLHQVIKEALRLYQVTPIIGREVEGEDINVNGCTVPVGASVFLLFHAAHRDPRLFPDPNKFDPDRFSPGRRRGEHKYSFNPFSGGPRNCIGMRYARMVMQFVLSTILKHYQVLPGNSREDMEHLTMEATLHITKGYNIRLRSRNWVVTSLQDGQG